MKLTPDLLVADRFRLVRPLGEGGMGAVWLAMHARLQIPCAVKFMRPEVAAEPAYRSRFDREAVAAAQMRSPHVVHILDHGVWEGAPYIAMEYLEGEDLSHRLARQRTISPAETVHIVTHVARALTRAHAAGLVHRDLKPGNIFLARDDDRELVKVLDFGIAKVSGPATGSQTKTGAVLGTPYYMSPEQAQGTKAVDHRTDLWALGVVVFECLTGKLPFVSDAFGDLVLKIIVEEIPVPSHIAPVPPGFDAWWARAVARDPEARFQSAKEMAEALAQALGVSLPGDIGAPSALLPSAQGSAGPQTPAGGLGGTPAPSGSQTVVGAAASVAPTPKSRSSMLAGLAVAVVVAVGIFAFVRRPAVPIEAAAQPVASIEAPPSLEVSAAPAASSAVLAAASAVPAAASAVPAAATKPVAHPREKKPTPPKAPSTATQQAHDIGF